MTPREKLKPECQMNSGFFAVYVLTGGLQ